MNATQEQQSNLMDEVAAAVSLALSEEPGLTGEQLTLKWVETPSPWASKARAMRSYPNRIINPNQRHE